MKLSLLRTRKLNTSGFVHHFILPVLAIAAVAGIGTVYLALTHAATVGLYTGNCSQKIQLLQSAAASANKTCTQQVQDLVDIYQYSTTSHFSINASASSQEVFSYGGETMLTMNGNYNGATQYAVGVLSKNNNPNLTNGTSGTWQLFCSNVAGKLSTAAFTQHSTYDFSPSRNKAVGYYIGSSGATIFKNVCGSKSSSASGGASSSPTSGTANNTAACTTIGGFGEPNACYVQMGGDQTGLSATGVSANFSVWTPRCGSDCGHVANEFFATDSAGDTIEYGWTVPPNSAAGAHPLLGIGLWAKGQPLDADANFVQVSKTAKINMVLPVNGTKANLKILYVSASKQWQLFYNGTEVGYYPESIWTSRGTSLTALQTIYIFGEIVGTSAAPSVNAQMGNGVLGTSSGAATISNYTLYGTSTAPNLTPYSGIKNTKYYAVGNSTATGFSYGGPGL
jgi:hypothetical protein